MAETTHRQITDRDIRRVQAALEDELRRAEAKHPDWPDDPIHRAAIVAKEAGELVQASIDACYSKRPIEREKARRRMRIEAEQVGAMALRLLINLDEPTPGAPEPTPVRGGQGRDGEDVAGAGVVAAVTGLVLLAFGGLAWLAALLTGGPLS